MSEQPQVREQHADAPAPLDVLKLRAQARAILWAEGLIATIPEAVDKLQAFAVSSGLVDAVGQDRVQQVLSDAFLPHREAEWMAQAQSAELDQPAAADDQLADDHHLEADGAAIWCGTCGCAPCTDPGFCAACRGADRRLAATPMGRFSWQPNEPDSGPRATPQSVIEAIVYCVRERGLGALDEPKNIERLATCDPAAMAEFNKCIAKLLETAA
jgi:hypothetical protein